MSQVISTPEQNYNQARAGQIRHSLLYLTVRDTSTGEFESVGFWTGADSQIFTIDGDDRLYFGAGAALDIDGIPGGTGVFVRYINASLGIVAEVAQAVRGFDLRLAPAEIHTAVFDLDTRSLVSEPRRVFKGTVNKATISTPSEDGSAAIDLSLASSARSLTRTLPLYRSDAELRRRNPSDSFRQSVSTTGLRQVAWGEASATQRDTRNTLITDQGIFRF